MVTVQALRYAAIVSYYLMLEAIAIASGYWVFLITGDFESAALTLSAVIITGMLLARFPQILLISMFTASFRCKRCRRDWPTCQWWRCQCGSIARRNPTITPCKACSRLAAYAVCDNCSASQPL